MTKLHVSSSINENQFIKEDFGANLGRFFHGLLEPLNFSAEILLLIEVLVDIWDHRLGVLNTIEFHDLFFNLILLGLVHLLNCILREEKGVIEVSHS